MGVYSYLLELHVKMVGAGREVESLEPAMQLLDLNGGNGGWSNQQLSPIPIPNGTLLYSCIYYVTSNYITIPCSYLSLLAIRHTTFGTDLDYQF